MKKGLVLSTVVLLLLCSLTLSSCFTLISAIAQDAGHVSKLKKETAITGGNGINWRNDLVYNEDKKENRTGTWYLNDIPVSFYTFGAESNYRGVSALHIMQNGSLYCELALIAKDDKPAGEVSTITVKKLGEAVNNTWIIKYILAVDGRSFNITDLGGLNSPPLRTGQYLNSDAVKDANAKALEGYGSFTVKNVSSNYSITQIIINGEQSLHFSRTYQVNLNPSASGAVGMLGGGSFEVGDVIAGKKVIPIGAYELTLVWSNGVRTTHRVTITSRGSIGNYNQ